MTVYRSQIFAARLRELCDTQPSHSFVAEKLGISRQQLSRYLAGNTIPRDGMIGAFARYFDVPVEKLFSDGSIGTMTNEPTAETGNTALGQFFETVQKEEITDIDLKPGFYQQYKKLFTKPGKYLASIAQITRDGTVMRYKRRSSVKYVDSLPGTDVKNTFNGVFFKQHNCLILLDVGSGIGDVTFHTLRTRYKYDTDVKIGFHMNTLNANEDAPLTRAAFILRRIRSDDSVLAAARKQGIVDLVDLPEDIQLMMT